MDPARRPAASALSRTASPLPLVLAVLAAGMLAAPPAPPADPAGRAALASRFVADSSAAIACLNRGEADSARALVAPLLPAARSLGDSAMVARALLVGVALDLRLTRALDAEPRILVAQRLAVAARDTGVWMRSLRSEAMVRNMRGDLAASDRIAARWLALAQAAGNRSEEAWARVMIAWLGRARGEGARSWTNLRAAEATFRALEELPGLGFTRNEIARAYIAEGNYDSARTACESTIDLGRRTGDPRMEGWGLANLGVVEQRIGDPVRSLELARRVMEGHRRRRELREYLIDASNLSLYALQLGRLDEARAIAYEGLALAERDSIGLEVPWQRMNLGDALWAAGRRDSARLLWAANLADTTSDPAVLALTASSLAHARAEEDSVAAAAAGLDAALARWGGALEQEGRVQLEIFRGELDTRLGRPDRVRARLLPVAERLEASGDAEYGLGAWLQIARADRMTGRPDLAAQARGRALALWEAGRARTASLDQRERRGEQAQLLLSETVLAAATPDSAFVALQRLKTRSLLERLAAPGPAGTRTAAAAPLDDVPFTADGFRAATLREGELFLEFVCAPDTTLLLAATKDATRLVGLPGARVLGPQIALARDAFATRPGAGGAAAARLAAEALGRTLLGGVADLVVAHPRIVVAPDGVLHRVPFAALAVGSEAPLVARRRVSIAPSAKFLRHLRAGLAPGGTGRMLAVSGGVGDVAALRGARAEVERLAEDFDGVETRFASAEGRVAVSANELSAYRALHFAGHSHADDQLPWRSGIVLGAGVGGDSLLTAAEIVAAPVAAGLVVLSSCESAGGRIRSGEGVSGLASAFLVAGAPAVVATLWPVDDRVTGALMERFYQAMAGGATAGDALRTAQEALRGRAQTAHPFYWAGFVLLGDPDVRLPLRTRALTAERAGAGIAIGLVALVATLALVLRWRQRAAGAAGRTLALVGALLAGSLAAAPAARAAAGTAAPLAADAPAESAAVARAAWGRMREARAAGDFAAALAHARRAHAAWPGQWVYAYGVASMAARAGDAAAVAHGLADLARLSAGPDLAADSALVAVASSPAGVAAGAAAALARVAANAAPAPRGTIAFAFPAADSAFWPEGLAWDERGQRFLVAGVREGRIAAIDARGAVRAFARIEEAPGWAALAVAVDGRRDLVWVTAAALPQATGYAVADSGRAAVFAFDRQSGRRQARHDLPPAAAGHVPGDVQVAANGDVFVSDSAHPAIYRIAHDGGRLEEWRTDPAFRSLQGQAFSADGRTLYVADYAHGLAAIDVATRAVRWLPAPDSVTTLGIDGLARVPAGLVAVQNGLVPPRIVLLELAGTGATERIARVETIDRDPGRADEPTLVVAHGPAGAPVYIANSQWEKHDEAGVRRPGTILTPPRAIALPTPAGR